jgi:ribosomal 50S subunit-recycling heat shock protein
MRLDKYLKLSRLIKRRSLAKTAADSERIEVNHKLAKPSTVLKVNDLITLHLGNKIIVVKVVFLTLVKDELMYELISETKKV